MCGFGLQSLNEESITVNLELQNRVEELSQTNDDIKNLLDSTQTATLFLNTNLQIRRFTPKMTEIISLVDNDINRPIADFSTGLKDTQLIDIARKVLQTLDKIETEVYSTRKSHYYRMRVLPYRTDNNVIDGVVISFEDISQFKAIEHYLRENEQRYKNIFNHCPIATFELDIVELSEFVKSENLTSLKQLNKIKKQISQDNKLLASKAKVLNVNKYAVSLFEGKTKETILNCFTQLLDIDQFLYQQMLAIIEQKQCHIFDLKVYSLNNETMTAKLTVNTPVKDQQFIYRNTILVIQI